MTEEIKDAAAEPSQEVANEAPDQAAPEREKAGLQEALMAERRKRQEAEAKSKYLEQQYQQFQSQYQTKQPEDDEDEYCKYEVTEHSVAHARAVLKDIIEAEYASLTQEDRDGDRGS